MTQEQRDGDQPWVLAGGHTGRGADESIELVGDVEFLEEGGQEATRPPETVRTIGEFLQNVGAMVLPLAPLAVKLKARETDAPPLASAP